MKFQDKCLGKMSDVSNQEGRTVLYVSHNMGTIKRLCDRCIVLDHGKKIFDGDVNEAIDIYSNNDVSLSNYHIFEKAGYWDYYMRTVQMQSLRILNSEDCIFNCGDELECELICHSDTDVNDLRLRVEYFNSTDTLVGMACTDLLGHFSKNENRTIRFRVPTSMLSAGKYKLYLALYTANDMGLSTTVDLGRNAMRFQINDHHNEKRIIWNDNGFTRYPDIQLLT